MIYRTRQKWTVLGTPSRLAAATHLGDVKRPRSPQRCPTLDNTAARTGISEVASDTSPDADSSVGQLKAMCHSDFEFVAIYGGRQRDFVPVLWPIGEFKSRTARILGWSHGALCAGRQRWLQPVARVDQAPALMNNPGVKRICGSFSASGRFRRMQFDAE